LSQAASMLSDEAWCMNERGQSESPQEQKSPPTSVGGMFNHLSMADFMQRRDEGWTPFILDVRSDAEYADARVAACDLQVPHSTIHGALDSIPQNADVVIFCKSGMRSQLAAIELIKSGYSAQRLYNLEGGIMAWNATAPDEVIG
ncbi:MAG TPA: rhodanese-like domain-containing protein, partial [Candidatus Poseidoniales archaeon]